MDTALLLQTAQVSATTVLNDFLVVILVVAVIGLYRFWRGKSSLLTLILGSYVALALYPFLPISLTLGSNVFQQFFINAGVFLALALVAHIVLDQVLYTDEWSYGVLGFAGSALLVLGLSVFFLAVAIQFLALPATLGVSPLLLNLFGSQSLLFVWLGAPLVAILVSSRL